MTAPEGRLPMTERGHPPLDEEELAMVRSVMHRLKGLIATDLESPTVNREAVYRFCEVAEMLRKMASGNPKRLTEYLDSH